MYRIYVCYTQGWDEAVDRKRRCEWNEDMQYTGHFAYAVSFLSNRKSLGVVLATSNFTFVGKAGGES